MREPGAALATNRARRACAHHASRTTPSQPTRPAAARAARRRCAPARRLPPNAAASAPSRPAVRLAPPRPPVSRCGRALREAGPSCAPRLTRLEGGLTCRAPRARPPSSCTAPSPWPCGSPPGKEGQAARRGGPGMAHGALRGPLCRGLERKRGCDVALRCGGGQCGAGPALRGLARGSWHAPGPHARAPPVGRPDPRRAAHLRDAHAPLPQRQQPGLRAHGLDVSAAQLVLTRDTAAARQQRRGRAGGARASARVQMDAVSHASSGSAPHTPRPAHAPTFPGVPSPSA